MSNPAQKPTIFIAKPLILKKKQLYITPKQFIFHPPLYKEDIIYQSCEGDFLGGECRGVTIVNKLNRLTNNSVTIAKFQSGSEKTSERVAYLIGQKNYDVLFSALCSVISQELKVRAILALLTFNKPKDSATQTAESSQKNFANVETQTEVIIDTYTKVKPKKRVKRQALAPYVAKEVEKTVKKVVIQPVTYKELPVLTGLDLHTENSNDSIGNISVTTTNSLLFNPDSWLDNIDRVTKRENELTEDMTVAEKSSMLFGNQNVPQNIVNKRQILKVQAKLDWDNCDRPDEDGCLPIHDAVKDNDIELLIRNCLALNAKKKSVDFTVNGDWTPLKMAIIKNHTSMTALLLRFGSNPLLADHDQKTSIHHAAEMPYSHLQAIVEHCMKNPRRILEQNDDLWDESYETLSEDRLSTLLLCRMCSMCDIQGYTPLMLASKLGNYQNVELLVEIAPGTINKQMPTCGNTALYLAIGAACTDCIERGDKTVVAPNFSRTIEILVAKGADPGIDNRSGSNVNILLTEFNIAPLSTLVANKLTSIKYFDGNMPEAAKNFDQYILVKNNEGTVDIMEMSKQKIKPVEFNKKAKDEPASAGPKDKPSSVGLKDQPASLGPNKRARETNQDKPVIVQNILLAPGGSKKVKLNDNQFESTFQKFIQKEQDKVRAGKAAVIKDIKIAPVRNEAKTIRQPAKKRIKNINK